MKLIKVSQVIGIVVSILCVYFVSFTDESTSMGINVSTILLLALTGVLIFTLILTVKVENQVLEKYHWYEQIIDLWENPLSITDMDMNWTFVNKTVEDLLKKKRSEVLGQQCSNWGANICNTDNCGVTCLRKGKPKSFFNQWDMDFRVNTHYLTNRKGKKIGHAEIVTNIHAQKQLSQLLKSARQAAASVASGSNELTNSAQTLSAGTTEQAASIEEISASLNEVENQTRMNSENAEQAKNLSNETRETVQRGNQQMEVLVESVRNINDTSSEVSKVIKVIDEIAFQTNLLALNAAIEAARAGKYGKGFAVVAEEVRALAGRSGEAAQDTTQLIEKSIKGVEAGVQNANETALILNEIVSSMEKMNDLVSEISGSSNEQNSSMKEISNGLSQVNTVVQQNASISEENASASEELKFQVNRLLKLTEGISVTEDIGEEQTKPEGTVTAPDAPLESPVKQFESESGSRSFISLDDDNFDKY